jgi:molybdopterin/thiamine biosynthesis adenylyltransferase
MVAEMGCLDELRYSRQMRFSPIGQAGQARIRAARVLLLGCGGLGAETANLLARAGVAFLRLVDRDVVELSNLQRQALFDEKDVKEGMPKAAAAARRIAQVNSGVQVEPIVADLDSSNILALMEGIDLVIDGFDNFEGRYLLNDACVKLGMPWVYGACVGGGGVAALLVPGVTPCLRCLQPHPPEVGASPTCDTLGILGPAAHLTASLEAGLALRYLVTRETSRCVSMLSADVWEGHFQRVDIPYLPKEQPCPCCVGRRFDFLDAPPPPAVVLCGREAVQVHPTVVARPDFATLAERLRETGEVVVNDYLLRLRMPPYEMTLFQDGRANVMGTADTTLARSLVARYFGM